MATEAGADRIQISYGGVGFLLEPDRNNVMSYYQCPTAKRSLSPLQLGQVHWAFSEGHRELYVYP